MRAWIVEQPGPIDTGPLRLVEQPDPEPGPGEVSIRVLACGVCRTDLHVAEGDLPRHRPRVVPGHEVVGDVTALGPGASRFQLGDRVGAAWLRHTCGSCGWCRRGAENLCEASQYTGWDVDGGYAESMVVPEAFAYRLPHELDPVEIAPWLCAGIIGYRALRRANVPPGGRLGIYGFGGSAHLTAQLAVASGTEVHAFTRGEPAQQLARSLGAASAHEAYAAAPVPLDAAILFAPVGDLVPVALESLTAGGTLAIAGIHLTDVPPLNYQAHLFRERTVTSVTSNTRRDGEEFLTMAARLGVHATTTGYPFTEADRALADLAHGRFTGAAVLVGEQAAPSSRFGP